MRDANLALRNHVADGRRVHLVSGAGGQVEYVGELELDEHAPHYETEAPETDDGPLRRVFVFRFRLRTGEPRGPRSRLVDALHPEAQIVPVEERWTKKYFVRPSAKELEAERREQELVLSLEAHLRSLGHEVARLKVVPPGERRPIFCDLFDTTAGVIVEAKGTVAREAVRMAIGQLMDYRRFVEPSVRLAILLPEKPRGDLLALIESTGVSALWPASSGFAGTDPDFLQPA